MGKNIPCFSIFLAAVMQVLYNMKEHFSNLVAYSQVYIKQAGSVKQAGCYIRTEFSEKKLLENKEMVLKNGVKNKQTAGYNGARTVCILKPLLGNGFFQA